MSLTARIKEVEDTGKIPSGSKLKEAQECLRKYAIDQVRNANVGAAVVYEWVRAHVKLADF